MSDTHEIQQLLTQYWGYSTFREKQEEIIQSVLDGNDTLALLPTGGGKSLCFQLPALANDGLCLVISPLIALIQDQVNGLKSKGIKAIGITSGMSRRELDISLDNAAYGDFKFLYVSPERLETELFQARLKKMNINLIAVDEAHCISQWGYDFRPAYLKIAELRKQLPEVPFLALTATATPKVVNDIQEKLEFKSKNVIQKSFERKNLAYVVLHDEDQIKRMLKVIDGVKGSGIIYVNTRKRTKEIAQQLLEHKVSADYYHAGLSHEERKIKQENWVNNKNRIIVSTNAFGMGIDKPNVRFVIHLDLPQSLEAYFQEAGRAGRDQQKAYAVLIMSPAMGHDLKSRIEQSFPPIKQIKTTYLAMANYLQIPNGGGENQSYAFSISDFAKRYNFNAYECYHALHFLEKEGYVALSENFSMPSRLFIRLNKEDLYKFQVANKIYDSFIKTVLRTYGGLFDDYVKINENDLAKNFETDRKKVVATLERLEELEVLNYEKQSSQPVLTFLKPRLAQESVRISNENYSDRKATALEKMNAVLHYAESKQFCRSSLLLEYFGEHGGHRCGICDVCLEQNKLDLSEQEFNAIASKLKDLLSSEKLTLTQLIEGVKEFKSKRVLKVLDFKVDVESIQTDGNYYWID